MSRLPSTPRFAFEDSLVLKNGVLFQSAENTQDKHTLGPGYYTPRHATLNRSSFNIRAQKTGHTMGHATTNPPTPRVR
jgi:hypothetical protein